MNDSSRTYGNALTKPTGPKARPPIHQSQQPTMSPKKKLNPTSPNSSLRNVSQKSPALSSPGSPRNVLDLHRRKNKLYPDLSNQLDEDDKEEFEASTPSSSDRQSRSQTRSDYSSESDNSLSRSECVNESIECSDAAPEYSGDDQNQNKLFLVIGVTAIVVLLAFFCQHYFFTTKSNVAVEENTDVLELRSKIMGLQRLFPSQDKGIWHDFASGIGDVKTKAHTPAIFLLLAIHNETTICLAKKMAQVAGQVLRGTGDVILTPNMLENNISKVFELMEEKMRRSKAVVVLDLLSLQAEAIKAFHDICDQYNPLVDEAVYFYTMRSPLREKSTNLMAVAEQELRNSFSKVIKEDTLKALITRITNGAVIAITAEESIPCSE